MNIEKANQKDLDYVEEKLSEYTNEVMPFTQEEEFISNAYTIKNENHEVVAGINAYYVGWKILYIDTLWVHKDYRRKGLATKLMNHVMKQGKEYGCYLVHLSTFDFQGKEFYESLGFDIYGVLEDAPVGHAEYFYKKIL